ncbi:MAG: chemotaxis protein CheW [candidate division WOR-3 bacterium]
MISDQNYFVVTIEDNTNLALPTESVIGIYPCPKLFSLPFSPANILGIGVVAGQAVPVVNITKKSLSIEVTAQKKPLLLILKNKLERFGILIDKVVGLKHFPNDRIKPVNPLENLPANLNLPGSIKSQKLQVFENNGTTIWLLDPKEMVWVEV